MFLFNLALANQIRILLMHMVGTRHTHIVGFKNIPSAKSVDDHFSKTTASTVSFPYIDNYVQCTST